jgi:hypothetical protein
VGNDRLSQIGSAVVAEVAAGADLGSELLRRVGSAARLAERHRMVRTQREEQRSESDEQQHDAASSSSKHKPVKPGGEIIRCKVWILVDKARTPQTLLHLLPRIALCPCAGTYPPRGNSPKFNGSFRGSRNGNFRGGEAHGATPIAHCGEVVASQMPHVFAA